MGGGKHLAPPGSSASIYSLRPVTPGPTGNIELDSEAAVEAVTSSHVVMSSPAHSAQNDPGLNVLATKSSWINALILKDRSTGRLVVTLESQSAPTSMISEVLVIAPANRTFSSSTHTRSVV